MLSLQISNLNKIQIVKYLSIKDKVQILIWSELSKKGKLLGGILLIFLYHNNNIYISFVYLSLLYFIKQKIKKSGIKKYKTEFNNFVATKMILLLIFFCIKQELKKESINTIKLECKPNILLESYINFTKNTKFNILNLFNEVYNHYILSIYRIEIVLILSIIIMKLILQSLKISNIITEYQTFKILKWQKQKRFFFILTFSSQMFTIIINEIDKFKTSLKIRNKTIFLFKLQNNFEIVNLFHIYYIRKKESIKKNIISAMYLDNSLDLNFFYNGIKPISYLKKSNCYFIILGSILLTLLLII
nr:hypothetical protein [Madagascaria erythrocladioides]